MPAVFVKSILNRAGKRTTFPRLHLTRWPTADCHQLKRNGDSQFCVTNNQRGSLQKQLQQRTPSSSPMFGFKTLMVCNVSFISLCLECCLVGLTATVCLGLKPQHCIAAFLYLKTLFEKALK